MSIPSPKPDERLTPARRIRRSVVHMDLSALEFRLTSARVADDSYVVSLGGEVDLHTAPQVDERLRALVADGARHIVVDFGTTSFIDSTVLGVLLKTLKLLDASGGALVLVSDDLRILRTFEVAGLNRIFRIVPSLNDALETVGAAAA